MIIILPVNDDYGTELEACVPLEVYEYYDGPKLFLVKNTIGHLYLCYWFDEKLDGTGWLCLPISQPRVDRLKSKEITLRDAYRNAEKGYLLVYQGPSQYSIKHQYWVNQEWLPPENFYVEHASPYKVGMG